MKRYESYRTIQTIQRYGLDIEETVLDYNLETRSIVVGGSKQEKDVDRTEEAIIDFLAKKGEPVTEKVINDEVEGRTTLKRKALRELIRQDEIVKSGKGGRGDPYRYSCSQENTCSHQKNEFGNNKDDQKNDTKKDSCSLVPNVRWEQPNKIIKTTGNPLGCKKDSCSHIPLKEERAREQVFLVKNPAEEIPEKLTVGCGENGQNFVSNEPINLDEMEVEL